MKTRFTAVILSIVLLSACAASSEKHIKAPDLPALEKFTTTGEKHEEPCGKFTNKYFFIDATQSKWFVTLFNDQPHPLVIGRLYPVIAKGPELEVRIEVWIDKNMDGSFDEYFEGKFLDPDNEYHKKYSTTCSHLKTYN